MRYPAFFDAVPKIVLHDPLAEFLGAADEGIVEYAYPDAVKLAGHSCPTVASAYWMTYKALAALYREELPQRGSIRVEFGKAHTDGVTGVIANVVSLLTGAATDAGFKGIGGHFDRRDKLYFDVDMPVEVRFTRLDSGQAVWVTVDLRSVSSPRRGCGSCCRDVWTAAPARKNARNSGRCGRAGSRPFYCNMLTIRRCLRSRRYNLSFSWSAVLPSVVVQHFSQDQTRPASHAGRPLRRRW